MIRTLGWSKGWFMPLCHCSLRHTRALWSAAPTNALISSFSSQAYMWKPCENTGPEIHCGEAKVADPYFCHRLKYNIVQRILLDLCWQFDWENSDSFDLFYFSLNHQEHLFSHFCHSDYTSFGFHSIMTLFCMTARIQHDNMEMFYFILVKICFKFSPYFDMSYSLILVKFTDYNGMEWMNK